MIETPGAVRYADYFASGVLFSGSVLTVVAVGTLLRYVLGRGLKSSPDPIPAAVLSRRIRLCGFLLVAVVACVLSVLYAVSPWLLPRSWSVCALGAAVTGLVWLRFRHAAWKALPENEPLSGMAAADCYVLLYLFCLLSFALLMAMGGNAGKAIPEWPCMATGTMVVGLTGSAIVVAAGFVLSGVWRSCLTVLVAGLWVLAVLWLAARAMQGLPTQALIDTGMLDRRGPFWAVVAALIELPLVRYLALRYAQDGGNRRGRSVYLFGRLERPAMLVLLPCLLQWMAWQLAGCYGLGLAGAVVAVSLTMWLPFDLASAAVQAEGEQAKVHRTALHATLLIACFTAMTSVLALVALYL